MVKLPGANAQVRIAVKAFTLFPPPAVTKAQDRIRHDEAVREVTRAVTAWYYENG